MIVEIDDDFLSLPSRKRGQRKSRLVVSSFVCGGCPSFGYRQNARREMVFFHFERVSPLHRLYPLALEDEEGKRKKRDG